MTRMFGRRPVRAVNAASFARAASACSGKTKAGSRCGAMGVAGLAIGSKGGMRRRYAARRGLTRGRAALRSSKTTRLSLVQVRSLLELDHDGLLDDAACLTGGQWG